MAAALTDPSRLEV